MRVFGRRVQDRLRASFRLYPARTRLPFDDVAGPVLGVLVQQVGGREDERLTDQIRLLGVSGRMSKSGLYAHFASKEELQLATIRHVLDVFEAKVVRDPPDEPEGGLGALLERWLNFFEDKVFPGGCFVITCAVEFASRRGRSRQ